MKRMLVFGFVLATACGAPAPVTVPPLTTARPDDGKLGPLPGESVTLTGEVVAAANVERKGILVLGYRTADEQRAIDAGRFTLAIARAMMDRWRVVGEVDFAKTPRVPYAIEHAPADAVPVAVVDVGHTFWATVFGGGKGLVGQAKNGGGVLAVAPAPAKKTEGEPCSGPRRKLVVVTSAHPKIGARRFCAWLPASFESAPKRRYPVVFLLPGLLSKEMSYLGGTKHLGHRVDALGREVVLVGVDSSNDTGSTYFEDSPVTGPFDSFFVKEALPAIERDVHGIGARTARALVGQSTGGYNALSLGLRHSDRFSVIGASSPDAPDLEAWLLEPGTRRAKPWILHWTQLEDAVGGAGQMTSYAANWSPDPSSARGFRWPIDLATGEADEATLGRWVARSPHGLTRDPAFVARAKTDLSGRISIIVGRHDEFELFAPAEKTAAELDRLGIATEFVATEQGHGDQEPRLARAIAFALDRLDPARDEK